MVKNGLFCVIIAFIAPVASAEGIGAPSRPGIDAPELAALGTFAVGVRTVTVVDRDAVDVLSFDVSTGKAAQRDRKLLVDIWYPATPSAGATAETYTAMMESEPPAVPAHFAIPGIAVRDAPPIKGRFPLIIVSHGYGNVTAGMSWLTENLASKGYVVAAIRHEDTAYGEAAGFSQVLLRRPLDIAVVAHDLQRSRNWAGVLDSNRTALVGYSMGGYGVLTAAGAILDPKGPIMNLVPGGLLEPYAQGGVHVAAVKVQNVRAVVAISPAGGSLNAWGLTGLGGIDAPLMLISGDHDHTVDYTSGARHIYEAARGARRYLLTFLGAGHALGLGPAPEEMRQHLWDQDWFEDPVWRKDRLIGVNLHMITAFLDRYVKHDETRAAYLDVLTPLSSEGVWPVPSATVTPPATAVSPATARAPYDARSPGGAENSVWKGFQRKHAEGLELLQHAPDSMGASRH